MPGGKVPQAEGWAGAKPLGLDTTWSYVELSCLLSEGGTMQHPEKRRGSTPLSSELGAEPTEWLMEWMWGVG